MMKVYEQHARYKKACAIAFALRGMGITGVEAARFTDKQRDLARRIAGQHTPSDHTWGLIVEMLI